MQRRLVGRGELDKLIALSAPREESGMGNRAEPPRSSRPSPERDVPQDEYRSDREYRSPQKRIPARERIPPQVDRPYPSERDRYEQRYPDYHKPKKR